MTSGTSGSVQYRVAVSKTEEIVEGPDDAELIVNVPLSVVTSDAFDATAEFMRGRLKAAGSTGALFKLLASGAVDAELNRLASRP